MNKTERLLNLIAVLLNTRRLLTVDELRARLYPDEPSTDSFHRKFERDKADIRDLGFTIESSEISLGAGVGYRIRRSEALLEDVGLTADEMAALSLAAQTWGDAGEGTLGLLKLSVGAGAPSATSVSWFVPPVSAGQDVLTAMDAIARRKVVRFRYRTGGVGESHERTVAPYGLANRGAWYLSGFDEEKGEVRQFKLSRVDGDVTINAGDEPDFDPPATVDIGVPRGPWDGESSFEAAVAFHPEVAWWVQRRTGARPTLERDDGWVEVALPATDVGAFAGWLAGFGDRAEALGPPELRHAVIAHLTAIAETL